MADLGIKFNLSGDKKGEFRMGYGVERNKRIANDLTELTGNTPLVRLSRYAADKKAVGNILAKLEYFNPLGSSKDRVAIQMIEDAEKAGKLSPGGVIIEPTSGNTGIGLAFAALLKGYKMIIVMPENMSEERKLLMRALAAELVLTPASEGMNGAAEKAKELAATRENAFIPDQFSNPSNPQAHRNTTAPEILKDTYGEVDCFVAGVGTGGTLTGVGEVLKAFNSEIKIVAVEPAESPLLSGGQAGKHGIQGIGANFIPQILNREIIDEIFPVTTAQSVMAAREAARLEGLIVGISSGAALYAACEIAKRPEFKDKNIVVLLPDSGLKYLSSNLYI